MCLASRGISDSWRPPARRLQAVRVGRPARGSKTGAVVVARDGVGAKWEQKTRRVSDLIANPSYCLVAGARNHLQVNRSLGFCFEIAI